MEEKTLMTLVVILAGENSSLSGVVLAWGMGVLLLPLTASIEQLRECAADLFIIDSGFQPERGLRLLHELKARWHDIPIIFLTDASSEEMAIGAFRAGAREYFRKPADTSELLETVQHLLHFRCGTREKRVSLRARRNERLSLPDSPSTTELPENLRRAVSFIEQNLSSTLSLEAIAREACVSKYHFCRVFRRHLKMSPMTFVTHMRMERAKKLLDRNMSVSAVALRSGFNDLSSFIQHFKRITGLTPTAYRKRTGPS